MILIDQARDIRRIAHALEAMNERRIKTPFNEDKLIVQIMVCLKEEEQKLADQLEAEDDDGATQGWIEALLNAEKVRILPSSPPQQRKT